MDGIRFSVWYLDDGTFIGTHSAIVSKVQLFGPEFGIHLNLAMCEVFWSSGDQSFKEFPPSICCIIQHEGGAALLGSPVYGSDDFYESFQRQSYYTTGTASAGAWLQAIPNPNLGLSMSL